MTKRTKDSYAKGYDDGYEVALRRIIADMEASKDAQWSWYERQAINRVIRTAETHLAERANKSAVAGKK